MKCAVEMASCGMTHVPSFMKIFTGFQTILKFCLSNLNDRNISITDGSDL
jgi:hypothetical protein